MADQEWNTIISNENSTSYAGDAALDARLVTGSLPNAIDWNAYISDESIDTILRARRWINPDVTKKYKQAIETTLSYSREYPTLASFEQTPKYPIRNDGYEIAYLGLAPFTPS